MTGKGIVARRTKGFYYLLVEDGSEVECKVKGQLFKDSRYDNQIAVGDRVAFQQSESDGLGLITGIEERKSFLSRTRVGIEAEQVIAANVDTMLIVASASSPSFRANLVNRLLVAARAGNITPVLLITKTDLVDDDAVDTLISPYRSLDLQIVRSSIHNDFPVQLLLEIFSGKICVLAGQSGVGKSSLLNRLFPDLNIKVGAVSAKTSKGSHTTSYAVMHRVGDGGFVIDTPGIREFGLWHIDTDSLREVYPLIDELGTHCKHRDCHHVREPQCAVKEAVKNGTLDESLYQGYLSIYQSLQDRSS